MACDDGIDEYSPDEEDDGIDEDLCYEIRKTP